MVPSLPGRSRKKVSTSYTPTVAGPAGPVTPVGGTTGPGNTGSATGSTAGAQQPGRARPARLVPSERFDDFYAAGWQPLLLQTFAVCGDLASAREATRHAFVDAWHHWSRAEWRGPAEYVRSQAFARGQLRSRTRLRRRDQPVDDVQQQTLAALDALQAVPRKAVVLACLSRIELPDIARQVAETDERTLQLVDEGLEALGRMLEVPGDDVPARLRALAPAARAAAQPTATEIRAAGVRRRRGWLAGGAAAAVVLTLGAGALVHADPPIPAAAARPLGPTVTPDLLLPVGGLSPLGKPANWTVRSTSDNTKGDGLNTFCQTSRFADPQGLRAYVRTYRLDGVYQRQATQTIELSRSARQSSKAFRTVLGWFGGCSTSQLLTSYDVAGLGDEAEVIKMRAQVPVADQAGAGPTTSDGADAAEKGGGGLSSYSVGVVRTGDIVTWTAFTTQGASNPGTDLLVSTLSNALKRVCTSRAAGACDSRPTVTQNPPPPSGEQAGMLAVADLPPVPGITDPWVGTDASTPSTNPSATTCDTTSFAAAGADPRYVRTFLIPEARVPARFGLTETLGVFPGVPAAQALIDTVTKRMASCEDRDPGATVSQEASRPNGIGDSTWHLWRLESEVSDKQTVFYWMGVARAGGNAVQVAFVPGDGKQDLTKAEFTALIVRARDRLFELDSSSGASSSSSSSSPSGSPSASGSPTTGADVG